MHPTLVKLEDQKRALLARINGWSPARLAFRPSPGAWSVTEMLDHLVRVEKDILLFAQQGLGHPHPIGLRDRLGFTMLDVLFRTRSKVKVPPTAANVMPVPAPDHAEILARWNHTRENLDQFTGSLSSAQFDAGIFRHPVSGWMNMPRILRFFSVHLVHHGFQLDRIEAASTRLDGAPQAPARRSGS